MRCKYDTLSTSPFSDHSMIIQLVPPGSRVLDVGCATGYLAPGLHDKGCHVTGIDYDAEALEKAKERCDETYRVDLESQEPWSLPQGSFDVLILSNVLEHLRSPSQTIERLKGFLRQEGTLIAIVPNIAKWNMRIELLLGRFNYQSHGVLDNTHLRFYTLKTGRELVESCGFSVVDVQPTPMGLVAPIVRGSVFLQRVIFLITRLWPSLLASQFIYVGAMGEKG
jgi:methionine biosynthesis protein MetW